MRYKDGFDGHDVAAIAFLIAAAEYDVAYFRGLYSLKFYKRMQDADQTLALVEAESE